MKTPVITMLLWLPFIQLYAHKGNDKIMVLPETVAIKGSKFVLEYQVFESHDRSSTDIDTVHHQGDYIFFSPEGTAYMNYNKKLDSISYTFPDNRSVTFGDTPFVITILGNGFINLYQNEEEDNGDYNRVTYFLKKESR